jgi:hypothetical protein
MSTPPPDKLATAILTATVTVAGWDDDAQAVERAWPADWICRRLDLRADASVLAAEGFEQRVHHRRRDVVGAQGTGDTSHGTQLIEVGEAALALHEVSFHLVALLVVERTVEVVVEELDDVPAGEVFRGHRRIVERSMPMRRTAPRRVARLDTATRTTTRIAGHVDHSP